MRATDVKPTRLEAAVAARQELGRTHETAAPPAATKAEITPGRGRH